MAATVTMAIFLITIVGQGDTNEPFTEFYLLAPDGRAEGYPTALTVGEEASLILGIVNREGKDAVYSIATFINGSPADAIGGVMLGRRQRWEQTVSFALTQAGERQLVEFVLYLNGDGRPYRTLRLWVDGEEGEGRVLAEVEAPTAAREEVPPSQTATIESKAQPTPEPRYQIHIVERGENLTAISRRYGVPLEAVIQANASEIPNPNLIYPDQRILIPVEAR